MVSNDNPANESEDVLGRTDFADIVNRIVRDLPTDSSTVVGLFAPWGAGKSTVLAMLRTRLLKDSKTCVIDLNPWAYDTEWQLLDALFESVYRELADTLGDSARRLLNTFKRYGAQMVKNSQLAVRMPLGPVEFSASAAIARGLTDHQIDHLKELNSLRRELSAQLVRSPQPVVVLIDDLDRMHHKRIRAFFRLLNLSLGLPQINYVVAADKDVVSRALGEDFGGDGGAALDKFIQVPLHLPEPPPIDLWNFAWDKIKQSLEFAKVGYEDADLRRIYQGLKRSFELVLRTPRQAKRFGNALIAPLSATGLDVDPYDLVHVEGLRLLLPECFEFVRTNRALILDDMSDGYMKEDERKERIKREMERAFRCVPESVRIRIQGLLGFLFPDMPQERYANTAHYEALSVWTGHNEKDRRIRSRAYFQEYFSYAPGTTGVRESAISALLDVAAQGDFDGVLQQFERICSPENQSTFIDTLGRRLESEKRSRAAELATKLLYERFDASTMRTELFWTWEGAITEGLRKVEPLSAREELAKNAVLWHSTVSINISLFQQLTKSTSSRKAVVESDGWKDTVVAELLDRCRTVVDDRGRWNDSSSPIGAAWHFLADKAPKDEQEKRRLDLLTDAARLERLLDAYRTHWSGGGAQFLDEDWRRIEEDIGVGDIEEAIRSHRIEVPAPPEPVRHLLDGDKVTALQTFVISRRLAEEVWAGKWQQA